MTRRGLAAFLALPLATASGAASAMDWLTPRLDANRFGNQLRHNQRLREQARRRRLEGAMPNAPSPQGDAFQHGGLPTGKPSASR
jgi:hypothetical protein